MFDYKRGRQRVSVPVGLQGEATKPRIPAGTPAGPAPEDCPAPVRHGWVDAILRGPGAQDELQAADVIVAVDWLTRRRCGLFYADPRTGWLPLAADGRSTRPTILQVEIDPETDDPEVLAGWVERLKGACCYVGNLRKRLKEPSFQEDVNVADLIFAVDGWSGERCGLFYGDPTTESLPRYRLMPMDAPVVLEVRVNRESDDLELLAEAVRDIKGGCCFSVEE